jgi:hypothetical protein
MGKQNATNAEKKGEDKDGDSVQINTDSGRQNATMLQETPK